MAQPCEGGAGWWGLWGILAVVTGWAMALATEWLLLRVRDRRRKEIAREPVAAFERVPLIRCRLEHRHASFWCPFCSVEHTHGWEPDDQRGVDGKQHRTAHCRELTSPYHERGYDIFVPEKP